MKVKEHCDYYTTQDTPSFNLKVGDCIKPVKGRFQPHKCEGICKHYDDTAYKFKKTLAGLAP